MTPHTPWAANTPNSAPVDENARAVRRSWLYPMTHRYVARFKLLPPQDWSWTFKLRNKT
jgi:hypothetical protein